MNTSFINPVSNTAKLTLYGLGFSDIPYAKDCAALYGAAGFNTIFETLGGPTSPVYWAVLAQFELRLKAVDSMIRAEGCKNVLDLACGYTPRGLYLAKEGYRYVGADLPAVVTEVDANLPALCAQAEMTDADKARLTYTAVDATNYTLLSQAAQPLEGPLTLTCEGMLSYMPRYEQQEVLGNIGRLLDAHGGVWLTTDFLNIEAQQVVSAANFIFRDVTEHTLSGDAVVQEAEGLRLLKEAGFAYTVEAFDSSRIPLTTLRSLEPALGEAAAARGIRHKVLRITRA